MTRCQREVLELLSAEKTAKEVAAVLDISVRTVEFHEYEMMRSLDIQSTAELIHFAIQHGFVKI